MRSLHSVYLIVPLLFGVESSTAFCCVEEPKSETIQITMPKAAQDSVEVRGWSAKGLQHLHALKANDPKWSQCVSVYVANQKSTRPVAVLGTHTLNGDRLKFTPQFPWQLGLPYEVHVNPGTLDPSLTPIKQTFRLSKASIGPASELVAIYPTARKLPENLLKFYLHFSAPMTQGDSYRFLHLYDEAGKEVELPFLELGEELWDKTGTRLTVFFDPGRIKRGLKPRMEDGPILVEGKRFRFVVEAGWEDAHGQPMRKPVEKWIDVLGPDSTQPDHRNWKIITPTAGTTKPLVLRFPESLDHAMLQRVLVVKNSAGEEVAGRIIITDHEKQWELHPDHAWRPGVYKLQIASVLEDVTGNSIGRPFEVDIVRPTTRSIPQVMVERTITIPAE